MQLKNCPFCGSLKNRLRVSIMPDGSKLHYIICRGCGATVSFVLNETIDSTMEMYNNRSTEEAKK